jgi:dihydropteroate synthase
MRPRFQWDLGCRSIPLGERTLVMGVLNVTPDSFSDGGRYLSSDAAIAHGIGLIDEGADILDIGGESTRPGTPVATSQHPSRPGAVSADEELARVLPVIETIKRERPSAVLSIDTYKARVARIAIDSGVEIVNDVSGFTWDSDMADTIAQRPCGAILMHTRGLPEEWRTQLPAADIVSLVREELRAHLSDALDHGIARRAIVIDPGFGFGKNFDENYLLLARFADFHILGCPLLAAVSRKGFLGQTVAASVALLEAESNGWPTSAPLLGEHGGSNGANTESPSSSTILSPPPSARENATLAASLAAALAGAHIVRVHAVRPAVEALAVADAILRASK